MPAAALLTDSHHATPHLSVVGQRKHVGIDHVGLLDGKADLKAGMQLDSVHHVVLRSLKSTRAEVSLSDAPGRRFLVHVVGYHLELSSDQIKDIEAKLHLYDTVVSDFCYIVIPTYDVPPYGPARINCVGLVLECYKEIDLVLLDVRHPEFPTTTLKNLIALYPNLERNLKTANMMDSLGLDSSQKEWPIVLPGYIFHAFAAGKYPFLPQSNDQVDFSAD